MSCVKRTNLFKTFWRLWKRECESWPISRGHQLDINERNDHRLINQFIFSSFVYTEKCPTSTNSAVEELGRNRRKTRQRAHRRGGERNRMHYGEILPSIGTACTSIGVLFDSDGFGPARTKGVSKTAQ